MGRIQLLSDDVANQIAAGEVVERPASVVKELVENSLDAGATRVDIAISDGGLSRISISDDGCGLAEDDLCLAFSRHATSKLQRAEQLFEIRTLGFRGEALPSIASVARVQVLTREQSSPSGWQLSVAGGELGQVVACGAPVGTTITVADLFYNTPARRQFMKSAPSESGRIRELVARMALAAPQVAFRLEQDERIVLETIGNNSLDDAILALYGRDVLSQLIPVSGGAAGISISGLISRPELTRNNRRDQVMILNGRLVQCRSLAMVLAEAYRSLLPGGRHPLAFLRIDLPPETVDVNVHPQKTEVRLREERQVAGILHRVLRQALELAGGQQPAVSANLGLRSVTAAGPAVGGTMPTGSTVRETPEVPISLQQVKQQLYLGQSWSGRTPGQPHLTERETACAALLPEGPLAVGEPPPPEPQAYRLLGQVRQSYIAIERGDGFWLVDQHAAHERIIYQQLTATGRQLAVQQLLVPYTLQLAPREAATLESSLPELAALGFDLEPFGGQTWLLRSLPDVYRGGFRADLFGDLVSELADGWGSNQRPEQLRERWLINLSCRAAIKAGQRLHPAEMVELLDQLWRTNLPFTCPHGRPTAISFDNEQLFRMFHP